MPHVVTVCQHSSNHPVAQSARAQRLPQGGSDLGALALLIGMLVRECACFVDNDECDRILTGLASLYHRLTFFTKV